MAKHEPWKKYLTMPVGFKLHYLDSGSFSLRVQAKKLFVREEDYYNSDMFWDFVDNYCQFIRKYKSAIDFYSVVDAIGFPEITSDVQQYMESEYGLKPIPVVHYQTKMEWLKHYMKRGYDYIAIGGLVGNHNQDVCREWIDEVFHTISDPDGMPQVKLHGFGVTSWPLLLRYPWFSVDSASWLKVGAFGGVLTPHKRKGRFVFDVPPYIVKTAFESPERKKRGRHYFTMTKCEQAIFREWLDRIEIPLGTMKKHTNEIVEVGVINDHSNRLIANQIYFEQLSLRIPEWPWAFKPVKRSGFGIQL